MCRSLFLVAYFCSLVDISNGSLNDGLSSSEVTPVGIRSKAVSQQDIQVCLEVLIYLRQLSQNNVGFKLGEKAVRDYLEESKKTMSGLKARNILCKKRYREGDKESVLLSFENKESVLLSFENMEKAFGVDNTLDKAILKVLEDYSTAFPGELLMDSCEDNEQGIIIESAGSVYKRLLQRTARRPNE